MSALVPLWYSALSVDFNVHRLNKMSKRKRSIKNKKRDNEKILKIKRT